MTIRAVHSTVYRYDAPVFIEPHVFRLCPRADAAQRLLWHELVIDPPPWHHSEALDQDGNIILHASFREAAAALSVISRFEVRTLRANPFDFLLDGPEALAVPLAYPSALAAALAPYIRSEEVDGAVRELAREVAAGAGWATVPFLAALCERLYSGTRQIVREEGPPLAARETLRAGEGSCRDLAVVFRDACRALGLAARFVSGYEAQEASDEPVSMHAWAEVYLPGGGWRGWDPSRGLAAADCHVAVAAAFDPALAAPMTGSFRGSARASMEVSLEMELK